MGYLRRIKAPGAPWPPPRPSRGTWISAGVSYCRSCPRNSRCFFSSSSWATASSLARSRLCVSSSSSRSHTFSWASRRACARSRCFSASSAPTCADRESSTCLRLGVKSQGPGPYPARQPLAQPRASSQARAPCSIQDPPDSRNPSSVTPRVHGDSQRHSQILPRGSLISPRHINYAQGHFMSHPCIPKFLQDLQFYGRTPSGSGVPVILKGPPNAA